MTPSPRFIGLGASLSDLPIPREYDLQTEGDEVDVEAPDGTDRVVGGVPTSAYVERFTEDGGLRVRSYPHQNDVPVEVVLQAPVGEVALGLEPTEARAVARHIREAAEECCEE